MRLGANFKKKVLGGRAFHQLLASTSTGTGLNLTGMKVGIYVLDRSAGDWFICTASAGTGTFVKVNA